MTATKQIDLRRADALRNRERILDAAERMLERSPSATLADIAAAAGVARSTLHRRFPNRDALLAALQDRPQESGLEAPGGTLPAGRLGRDRPVSLDAIHVFDVVPPAAVARTAGGRGAAHRSGSGGAVRSRHRRLPSAAHGRTATPRGELEASLAVGPELDADGLSDLREQLAAFPNAQVYALVAARPRQRSDDRLRSARGAAQRARTPGGGSDHPRRPLHGCVCPGAAPQAADGGRRDPAKPAPAPHLSDHGWGSCRERAPELRGRGGLVRRDRERRWGLDHPGRRIGRLDPGGREQRRRIGCPPSQSPQRWRHRRGARRDAPGAPRDARPARGDDSRCRALGTRERRAACGQLRPRGAGDPPRRWRGGAHADSQDPWPRRPSQRKAGRADDRLSPPAIAL